MADACCSSKRDTIAELGRKAEQRRVLIIVMLINLAMFVVEFGGGVVARSSALMADSVDMFGDARSEEHPSELQSLMRISYAVFCLKKKKKIDYSIRNTQKLTNYSQD